MSKAGNAEPRFSVERRKDLRNEGLVDAQIDELEAILPMCRLLIADDPPLRSVREKLEAVAQSIAGARKKIGEYANTPAALEARWRIDAASRTLGGDLGETERACAALDDLGRVVERAISDLGTKQRRTNRAANMPIKLIDEALSRGRGLRGLHVKVSSAPEGVFMRIVAICYERMTGSEDVVTPLRAIRSYMGYLRRERAELNRRRKSVVTQDEKLDRSRFDRGALGLKRQGSKKPTLPF
jgi:hypothetical protein